MRYLDAALCFVEPVLKGLALGAKKRLSTALRPRTDRCYTTLFRSFVAFCVCTKLNMFELNDSHILSYLEYLITQGVSVNMLANNISACRAKFVMHGLHFPLWDHPNVRYMLKSVKINRPICITKKNIIDLQTLRQIVDHCDNMYLGQVFKAVFLLAFFGFLRLSNIAPHSLTSFDPSRHLCAGDLIFTSHFLKVILKWSKTIQDRNKIHLLSLPRVSGLNLCPYIACKQAIRMYLPGPNDPLFQIKCGASWQVLTDTRIRKFLAKINLKLGLSKSHYTFHSFRRSGATLAYNSQVPVHQIKDHGSWSSDCVWSYINKHHTNGEHIASTFAKLLS